MIYILPFWFIAFFVFVYEMIVPDGAEWIKQL